jgi:uncharacterized membrane protein
LIKRRELNMQRNSEWDVIANEAVAGVQAMLAKIAA